MNRFTGHGSYKVIFYCPDENLKFNGNTPALKGLGGGKTAITKMAAALVRVGCGVKVYAYTEEGIYAGVEYIDYKKIGGESCDVLVVITGHKCDISEIYETDIQAKLKILWISGVQPIRNVRDSFFDFYYANSVFMKKKAVFEWGLPIYKIVTTYQGYDPEDISDFDISSIRREKMGIVFASHPSKGLTRIIDIVRRLRTDIDNRFFLDIYGGFRLWDDSATDDIVFKEDWITYKGLLSQPELSKRLFSYGFMFHLTDYPDTSSILVQQAKKAGIIVIASDVGGNSEIITDGYNGFIIKDHYMDENCYAQVKRLVKYLLDNEEYDSYIRVKAEQSALNWNEIANRWIYHWDDVLKGKKAGKKVLVSGFYGFKNLGDEAILSSLIHKLKKNDSGIRITVVSGDPFFTEKLHGVPSVHRDNFRDQLKAVEEADLIILGGGGLFQDHDQISIANFFEDHRFGVTSYANCPLMGKILGKPVYYLYHGIGPLFSTESVYFTRWALSLADFISVRDRYSYFLATEILGIEREKVFLTLDAVLYDDHHDENRSLSLIIRNKIPLNREIVIVAPRFWIDKLSEDRVIKELRDSAIELIRKGMFIILMPFHLTEKGDSDLRVCQKIAEYLPSDSSRIVADYTTWEEVVSLYGRAKCSIGMRYHSLIASIISRTPMIAVCYDVKDSELMKDFDLESFALSIDEVRSKDILNMVDRLITNSNNFKASMDKILNELRYQRNYIDLGLSVNDN